MSTVVKRAVVAAASGVALATTLVATPAYAAGTCSSGHICMWEDFNYSGSLYVDYTPGSNPGDKFEINWWNGDNEISSVQNKTSKWAVLYANDGYTGTWVCIAPNSNSSNLAVSHGFDNDAESFILKTSCS